MELKKFLEDIGPGFKASEPKSNGLEISTKRADEARIHKGANVAYLAYLIDNREGQNLYYEIPLDKEGRIPKNKNVMKRRRGNTVKSNLEEIKQEYGKFLENVGDARTNNYVNGRSRTGNTKVLYDIITGQSYNTVMASEGKNSSKTEINPN